MLVAALSQVVHCYPDSVAGSVVGNIVVESEALADVQAVDTAAFDMAVVEDYEKEDFDMAAVQIEAGCLENYQESSFPADQAQEEGSGGLVL